MNINEDCQVVNSMPLEVYKISRNSRNTICKESDNIFQDKGYCASQQMTYYGYKLQAFCFLSSVIGTVYL